MVRANPEPHDVASFQNAKGAIVDTHSHRIHLAPLTYPLEVQARVIGVRRKKTVGLPGLTLHMIRKASIGIPESALRKRMHGLQIFRSERPSPACAMFRQGLIC